MERSNLVNEIIPKLKATKAKLHLFENGKHVSYDCQQTYTALIYMMDYFVKKGLKHGDRVGLVGENSFKWVVADLCCISMGLITVGMDENAGHDINRLREECSVDHLCLLDEDPRIAECFEAIKNSTLLDRKLDHHQFNHTDSIGFKFTSGSTGHVKALELRSWSVSDTLYNVQSMFNHNENDRVLVFLPLYLSQQRFWIYSAILFDHDVIIVPYRFAIAAIQRLSPTVIMGVPDFYDRLVENISIDNDNDMKTVKDFLGVNIRYLWTGSAPIKIETLQKYEKLNIPLYQGYGMNETCIVSKNFPNNNKIGSVGRVVDSKEVIVDENGHIFVKNKYSVTDRYTNTSEEESRKIFLDDGVVATGDVGYLDENEYLYITGRVKDIIVLSNGRKVAPQPIELELSNVSLVSQVVVFGDNRSYLTAIVFRENDSLSNDDIDAALKEINCNKKSDEKIFKYILSDDEISVENGLLTSQFKIRRGKIFNKYMNEINSLYES